LSDENSDPEFKLMGSQINYYFICKRKLWFFSRNIELEPESDLVKLGRLLHENRYKRKKMKEIQVDRIKVDFVEARRTREADDNVGTEQDNELNYSQMTSGSLSASKLGDPDQNRYTESLENLSPGVPGPSDAQKQIVIHEVKRSRKMQDAHLYQLLYYVYYLRKNYGVNVLRGVLHYPLLKQNVDVPLTKERIMQLEQTIRGIAEVNSLPRPPEAERKRYCKSCAFLDLCWA